MTKGKDEEQIDIVAKLDIAEDVEALEQAFAKGKRALRRIEQKAYDGYCDTLVRDAMAVTMLLLEAHIVANKSAEDHGIKQVPDANKRGSR